MKGLSTASKKLQPTSSTSSDITTESSPRRAPSGLKGLFELLEEYVKSPDFASFLEVKDVIALGQVCKSFRKLFNQEYVSLVIRLGNLEAPFRYLFWINKAPYIKYSFTYCWLRITNSYSIERRWRKQFSMNSIMDNVYERLKLEEEKIPDFPRIRSSIRKDVCRTYEDARIMQADWQKKMEDMLAALAVVYSDMGYCQGMSFIAGEILNVVEEEELAFWLFAGLIEKHHLRLLFMNVTFVCNSSK